MKLGRSAPIDERRHNSRLKKLRQHIFRHHIGQDILDDQFRFLLHFLTWILVALPLPLALIMPLVTLSSREEK
jgi:hypothetical protein